jgi:hypothetical protein
MKASLRPEVKKKLVDKAKKRLDHIRWPITPAIRKMCVTELQRMATSAGAGCAPEDGVRLAAIEKLMQLDTRNHEMAGELGWRAGLI